MSRRDRIDPETARLVEERLQSLLAENGPGSASASRSARRPAPSPVPEPASAPTPTPEPGAVVRSWRAAVLGFRRSHLVVIGAIVALGVLVAGWAVLRARPVAVAVTPPPVSASRAAPAPSTTATTPAGADGAGSSASPTLVVHVLGAVEKPGLVTLPAGARVQDALRAAGGLTDRADPGELNLAQPVADGQQILVGTEEEPNGEVRDGGAGGEGSGAPSGSSAAGGSGGSGPTVNLNTATAAQLEELPGVGPVMAGRIIDWRTENGRFSRVEELQEIDGVGPKTYAKLAPLCRV